MVSTRSDCLAIDSRARIVDDELRIPDDALQAEPLLDHAESLFSLERALHLDARSARDEPTPAAIAFCSPPGRRRALRALSKRRG